jgi:quercetin dioxygenase-like cupin family protein
MRSLTGLPTDQRVENWAKCGIEIAHHFSGRECAVEAHIPAGVSLPQHAHSYDHLSILASGTADVVVDGEAKRFTGPECIHIRAGKAHTVNAVTDVVWYCCHGTDAEDQAGLEREVLP